MVNLKDKLKKSGRIVVVAGTIATIGVVGHACSQDQTPLKSNKEYQEIALQFAMGIANDTTRTNYEITSDVRYSNKGHPTMDLFYKGDLAKKDNYLDERNVISIDPKNDFAYFAGPD